MVPTDVAVGAARDCRVLAVRLAALAGRRLDEAAPFVDGILPSGVRLHAITRHMLGLMAGRAGARSWRRVLSEGARSPRAGPELLSAALAAAA